VTDWLQLPHIIVVVEDFRRSNSV